MCEIGFMRYNVAEEVCKFLNRKPKRGNTECFIISPSEKTLKEKFFEQYKKHHGIDSYQAADKNEKVYIFEVSSPNKEYVMIHKGQMTSILYEFTDVFTLPIILEIGKVYQLDTEDILEVLLNYFRFWNPNMPKITKLLSEHHLQAEIVFNISNEAPYLNYPPYFLVSIEQIQPLCNEIYKGKINNGDFNHRIEKHINEKLDKLDYSKNIFISFDKKI